MQKTVRVWDILIRLFHWTLVIAFFTAYLSEDESKTVHQAAGYTVMGLIAFRLLWGFIGTRYARFSEFVKGPRTTARYLGEMATGKAPRYLGHNPAGAAMIVALLISLTCTTVLGVILLATDGHGPLAGTLFAHLREHTVEEVHEFFANTSIFLVLFHVIGVLLSSLLHRENLVRSMISGRKRLDNESVPTQATVNDTSTVIG